MQEIKKIKKLSIWIFIVPFVALNTCLILITNFHQLFPNQEHIILNTIPYIDGGTSISRTARVFPTYLIFKPAMFLTSYLLIKYWVYNHSLMKIADTTLKYRKYFLFFGIGSAILLIIHSILLGIKFDISIYKFFRRFVILFFIIFEIVAQAYLVINLYKLKDKLTNFINKKILILKIILVSSLILVAIICIPIVSMPGNKFFKHALEWDYFLGVITFYLLTYFMWKKNIPKTSLKKT